MAFQGMIKSFRKHTKVWMAGLILLSMVTFVLCTGLQGDFGSWLLSLVGGGRGRGEAVARINGKDVTAFQVAQLKLRSKAVNEFLSLAGDAARTNRLSELTGKLEPQTRELLVNSTMAGLLKTHNLQVMSAQLRRFQDQFQLFQSASKELRDMLLGQALRLQDQVRALRGLEADWKAKKLSAEVLVGVCSSVFPSDLNAGFSETKIVLRGERKLGQENALNELQLALNDIQNAPKGPIFEPEENDEAAFEFILWRNEADRLDIYLTDDSVRAAVNQVTKGTLTGDNWAALANEVRARTNNQDVTEDYLINALRDEFRVRLAKTWHLGYQPSTDPSFNPPVGLTPSQCWQYYQDNLSPFNVQILPLPVQEFVSKVPEPTDQQLKEFFEQYKTQLREPDSLKPGFKEPKKVEVEWLSGKAESPYYEGLGAFLGPRNPGLFGLAWKLALLDDYKERGFRQGLLSQPINFGENRVIFRPREWQKPEQAVALLGPGPVPVAPLMVPSVHAAGVMALNKGEAERRAKAYASVVLSGSGPVPGLLTFAKSLSRVETSAPYAEVRPFLVHEMEKSAADRLFQANRKALFQKLLTLNPSRFPEEIRERNVMRVLKEAAQEYHFSFGPDPKDPTKSTPWLTPAEVRAVKAGPLEPVKKISRDSRLEPVLFGPELTYIPIFLATIPQRNSEEVMFTSPDTMVVIWKTATRNEEVPGSYKEVRAEVVKQWKYAQARKMAEKRAQEIAAQLRKLGPNDDKGRAALLAQLQKETSQKLVELKDVAPKQEVPVARETAFLNIQNYRLPSGEFHDAKPDWTQKLTSMGKEGQKKVEVLANQPETTYYVAARVSPPQASVKQFAKDYKFRTDPFWRDCEKFYAEQFRSQLVAQLKKVQGFEDLRKDKNKSE